MIRKVLFYGPLRHVMKLVVMGRTVLRGGNAQDRGSVVRQRERKVRCSGRHRHRLVSLAEGSAETGAASVAAMGVVRT